MADMTLDDVRAEIREFILPKFQDVPLDDACDIFSMGFVNSLFAMELVMFIEKLTGTRIPNAEVRLNNFRSVDAMTALVGRITVAEPEMSEA